MARAPNHHGFEEAGLGHVIAVADTENAASLRLMRKAGMRFEGQAVRDGRRETRYAILREE